MRSTSSGFSGTSVRTMVVSVTRASLGHLGLGLTP